MCAYPLEKLQEKLDRQLVWRKKELHFLKDSIRDSEDHMLNTAIRAGILLLYSHWEGFIKMTSREYLKYLNQQNCRVSQMKDNLLALHLKKTIIELSSTNKTSKIPILLNKINNSEETFKVKPMDRDIINTNHNLNFEWFYEILYTLGIVNDEFETKKHYIDKKLLDKRNDIAHGEYTQFVILYDQHSIKSAKDDFFELFDVIINLLDKFKDEIVEAGINKSHLKLEKV
jgi:hypothetical protein